MVCDLPFVAAGQLREYQTLRRPI